MGAKNFKHTADAMRAVAKGRVVTIVQDADEAGDQYAAEASAALRKVAESGRVLQLPRLTYTKKHGEDFSDWLDAHGGSLEELA